MEPFGSASEPAAAPADVLAAVLAVALAAAFDDVLAEVLVAAALALLVVVLVEGVEQAASRHPAASRATDSVRLFNTGFLSWRELDKAGMSGLRPRRTPRVGN